MRLLWVKAGKILPVDTGGRIRSFHILRALAVREQVTFLSYYGGPHDSEYETLLKERIPGSIAINTGTSDAAGFSQKIDYLRNLSRSAPYAVSKFTHPRVQKAIADWCSGEQVDVAICDFLSASMNFPEILPKPTVLFQHNVESSLWRRLAATEKQPAKRLVFKIESAKMERYERRALRRFHHVIAVSEVDRQQMLAMNSGCPITVVPTGVDCAGFSRAEPSRSTSPRIVFVGSMDWEPNIDAVAFFARDIWPSIQAQFPAAVFEIVGRNPDAKVRDLASDSIRISGTVPSIVPYLREATVVVVPLRVGGGTRLKIFEAMAMGKAVVSTSIGAEGLDVASGRNLLLADDPRTFADAVLLLLRDSAVRRKYEEAAALQASKYDWTQIAQRFLTVLQETSLTHQSPRVTSNVVPARS